MIGRGRCALSFFILALSIAASRADIVPCVTLTGELAQGGLVRGAAPLGTTLMLDGRPVRVGADGVFLLGFGRDAPPRAELAIVYPGGKRATMALAVARRQFPVQRVSGLPGAKVNPPPEEQERIERERREIAEIRERDTDREFFARGFVWPAAGPISGIWGSQRILNGEPMRPHFGTDIAAPAGTPVVAPAGGIVALAERDLFYTGGTVMIDHGFGLTSVFAHLGRLDVEIGGSVERGAVIGAVGSSGRASGPHLHWGMNLFDLPVDPALAVKSFPAANAAVSPASADAAIATAPEKP